MARTSFDNTLIPNELDIRIAQETANLLDESIQQEAPTIAVNVGGTALSLPPGISRLLSSALHDLAAGRSVAIVPLEDEITTGEAAELLNVSRNFIVTLTDRGELPSRLVGSHRRIRLADALDYKRLNTERRLKTLAKLVAEGQELNPGY